MSPVDVVESVHPLRDPHPGAEVAQAQLALARAYRASGGVRPLLDRLHGARDPGEIAEIVHRQMAVVSGTLFNAPGEHPAELRRRHALTLGLTDIDLSYRSLYPGLDVGLYGCSHSMGIPSIAGPAAVVDQLGQLVRDGIGVWDDGVWPDVMDRYREACAQLVGGDLAHGDVAWAPNVSEVLSAVLESIEGGTLVFTSGHFTTGHYVHHQWAQNTGGQLREVKTDPDGSVPTDRVVDALDGEVRVVSLSHALFESGWVQDLHTVATEMQRRCPEAILLVDAYQTAGTVPIDARVLGDHTIVTAGGHKQLRASAGAGFVYVPRSLLPRILPRRTGWWGHAAPFGFEKGAVRRAEDATRLRTGTPTLAGMAMLLGELAALASSADGSISGGVLRARTVTRRLVTRMLEQARELGLEVRGDWDAERRGAFVCLRVPNGAAVVERLGHEGIRVDVRPVVPGESDGWVRVSGNGAGFGYEVDAVLQAIAAHGVHPPAG